MDIGGAGERGYLRYPRDQPAVPGGSLTQPGNLISHAVSFQLPVPGRLAIAGYVMCRERAAQLDPGDLTEL